MALVNEHCTSLPALLSGGEKRELAQEVPGWFLGDQSLEREFSFSDFRQAMDFVNSIALLSERQKHHPEISISYNKAHLTLLTQEIKGLSRNDFILAAKIDRLTEEKFPLEIKHESNEVNVRGMTALITGGPKRIGRGIALALAQEGINVVVHYRSSGQEAEVLCAELAERGVAAWPLQADFSHAESAATLIGRAKELAGKLDILVNNASIFPASTLDNLDFSNIVENMEVNAWSPFVLSREFNRVAGKGAIVNLLDGRIYGYDWTHVGYIVSKHAIAVLTRMMALEFAPNVRVNAVAPGLILPPPGKDHDYIDRLIDTIPLKRHGDPHDIAQTVVFLLKNGFVTGQIICVDGGRHLREYGNGPNSSL